VITLFARGSHPRGGEVVVGFGEGLEELGSAPEMVKRHQRGDH